MAGRAGSYRLAELASLGTNTDVLPKPDAPLGSANLQRLATQADLPAHHDGGAMGAGDTGAAKYLSNFNDILLTCTTDRLRAFERARRGADHLFDDR